MANKKRRALADRLRDLLDNLKDVLEPRQPAPAPIPIPRRDVYGKRR